MTRARDLADWGDQVPNAETAWVSWTPSFTNWALGNGTIDAKYKQVGKVVFFRIVFGVGSTTTKSGNIQFSLPVTDAAAFDDKYTVSCYLLDQGTEEYNFISSNASGKVIGVYQLSGGANRAITATAPFTFATGDQIRFTGFYEAA
jgi:hypothetical protein